MRHLQDERYRSYKIEFKQTFMCGIIARTFIIDKPLYAAASTKNDTMTLIKKHIDDILATGKFDTDARFTRKYNQAWGWK